MERIQDESCSFSTSALVLTERLPQVIYPANELVALGRQPYTPRLEPVVVQSILQKLMKLWSAVKSTHLAHKSITKLVMGGAKC
jgi:ABC-type cobalamin/Fe3+-siderophores transport system ATPase subunit